MTKRRLFSFHAMIDICHVCNCDRGLAYNVSADHTAKGLPVYVFTEVSTLDRQDWWSGNPFVCLCILTVCEVLQSRYKPYPPPHRRLAIPQEPILTVFAFTICTQYFVRRVRGSLCFSFHPARCIRRHYR